MTFQKTSDLFTAFLFLLQCIRCILVESVLDVTCPFRMKSVLVLAI